MFQLPLFNITHQQAELSTHRTTSALSNQSGTRGILKITAPSMSNLITTFESEKNLSNSCQFIALFPVIQLTQSDRTVLINLENSLLSRDDTSIIISHCHFLSNVVLNDFPAELFLQRSFILKVIFRLFDIL